MLKLYDKNSIYLGASQPHPASYNSYVTVAFKGGFYSKRVFTSFAFSLEFKVGGVLIESPNLL